MCVYVSAYFTLCSLFEPSFKIMSISLLQLFGYFIIGISQVLLVLFFKHINVTININFFGATTEMVNFGGTCQLAFFFTQYYMYLSIFL